MQHGYKENEDPCTSCTCKENGQYICTSQQCPLVDCPSGVMVRPEGQCCETCMMPTTVAPGKCISQKCAKKKPEKNVDINIYISLMLFL